MFPELFPDLAHYIYLWLAKVLVIVQNVIQLANDKDVQFLGKDFIDISWKLAEALDRPNALPGIHSGHT